MNVPEDKLLDKRLVHRHIDRGLVARATYAEALAGLPDVGGKATTVSVEVSSVGVSDVKAKDTGDNE